MGRTKEGTRPLWKCLSGSTFFVFCFFFSLLLRPSLIGKTPVFCFFVLFLNLTQNTSSGPTLARKDRCETEGLNSWGSNIGVWSSSLEDCTHHSLSEAGSVWARGTLE